MRLDREQIELLVGAIAIMLFGLALVILCRAREAVRELIVGTLDMGNLWRLVAPERPRYAVCSTGSPAPPGCGLALRSGGSYSAYS
jgi:hypothetical protein